MPSTRNRQAVRPKPIDRTWPSNCGRTRGPATGQDQGDAHDAGMSVGVNSDRIDISLSRRRLTELLAGQSIDVVMADAVQDRERGRSGKRHQAIELDDSTERLIARSVHAATGHRRRQQQRAPARRRSCLRGQQRGEKIPPLLRSVVMKPGIAACLTYVWYSGNGRPEKDSACLSALRRQ
jgi:superfamily II DNA helicase RecQ